MKSQVSPVGVVEPGRKLKDSFAQLDVMLLDNTYPVEPMMRQSCRMLGVAGFRSYSSSHDALKAIARERRPDVLFVNGNGTANDALAVCRSIRDRKKFPFPFLAIVMMLANVTRTQVLSARDAGVDEFLACPFSPKTLEQRLTAIVTDRRGFVDVPDYFGPCRRRGAMAQMLGAERRAGLSSLIDPETQTVYIG